MLRPFCLARLPFLIFGLLAFSLPAATLPLADPVEHTLTDAAGRSLDVRITGVSETALAVVRLSDNASFDIPLDKLSPAARELAARLLQTARANPVLPDTPWLAEVRRDFRIFDPARKRLAPPPASFGATQRWFILSVGYNASSFPVKKDSSRRSLKKHDPARACLLWLPGSETAIGIELAGEDLLPGAAILSYEAMTQAVDTVEPMGSRYVNEWFRKTASSTPDQSRSYSPSAPEIEELYRRMLARLPGYWPRPPPVSGTSGAGRTTTTWPHAWLCHRDGRPARFRGQPVQARIEEVIQLVNEKSDELE